MPARNTETLCDELRAIRKRAWFHEIFQNLGLDATADRYSGGGSKGSRSCRTELLRIAASHPVILSLALDAWEYEDEDEDGDDDHPQGDLLPDPDTLFEEFPSTEDLPDLVWSDARSVYATAGEALAPVPPEDVAAQLATALLAIADLQGKQADMERDMDKRARAQAVQLFKDSNAGTAEVTLVGGRQSRREVHAATAYELHPGFAVAPWDRSAAYTNVVTQRALRDGTSVADFSQLLFKNSMLKDQHTRLQKFAGVQPRFWSNPPKYSSTDYGHLGAARAAADHKLREEQEEMLRPLKPVVRALDFVAAAMEWVPSCENDDSLGARESAAISAEQAGMLLVELRSVRAMLSDCVHTVAYSVTGVQKKRDSALQKALMGTDCELEEELDEESADWVVDTSALHARAKGVRDVRKDLKPAAPYKPRGGNPNGGARGGKRGQQRGGGRQISQRERATNAANTAAQRKKADAARAKSAKGDKKGTQAGTAKPASKE